ncbi:MAG: hypothetical protein HYV93_03585 [Candidatus Rokubacteria bacterium]|nr:hypothetical protein [Candidatus Rokubacteria bacterium]
MAMQERLMLIVPRFDYELHAWLEKKFEGDPEVLVIRDRRAAQRRQRREMRHQDRRQCDRRGLAPHRTGVWLPVKTAAAHHAPVAARLGAT